LFTQSFLFISSVLLHFLETIIPTIPVNKSSYDHQYIIDPTGTKRPMPSGSAARATGVDGPSRPSYKCAENWIDDVVLVVARVWRTRISILWSPDLVFASELFPIVTSVPFHPKCGNAETRDIIKGLPRSFYFVLHAHRREARKYFNKRRYMRLSIAQAIGTNLE